MILRQWLVQACAVIAPLLALPAAGAQKLNAGALVLVNSSAPDYVTFQSRVEPYLHQFGVPFKLLDIAANPIADHLGDYSLLIIGHRGLDVLHRYLRPEIERRILAAVQGGTGLVSFDGLLASWHSGTPTPLYAFAGSLFGARFVPATPADSITLDSEHFISNLRPAPRTVKLKKPMLVPAITPPDGATVVARAGVTPLILAGRYGEGNTVLFTSTDWVDPGVKGRLYGLDDLVWRSLVWAARKPFVTRGMPKFLAFRVDDVSGFGLGSNQHLGWVLTANRYGLKPWLGVFIGDMREDAEATERLAQLTQQGLATASVHARRWPKFFYLDEPLQTDEAGRNILARPLPNEAIAANFREADHFFAEHHVVKSPLVLPHFYESAPNDFAGLKAGGTEFVGTVLLPGQGYGSLMPRLGPYLSSEPPRPSNGKDPVYMADWLEVPGHPEMNRQFFNFVVEIRDVTGYEWAPSGVPVDEAIRRGVEETRREFDSLVPGVLFTHESDHIQHISPEDWERILSGVMQQLASEHPVSVSLEHVSQYLRALRTSRLESASFASDSQGGAVALSGSADLPTKFYVWHATADGPTVSEYEAPPFREGATVQWH